MSSSLWQKGQSGNPFGMRPKMNAFRAICQTYSKEAFELLKELVENRATHEAVRLQGLKFILEHAWGKAPQSVEIKVTENVVPDMMTTEQLTLAAAGQTQELVCSLIASGKLDEYTREYVGIKSREEKDVMEECKEEHVNKDVGEVMEDESRKGRKVQRK